MNKVNLKNSTLMVIDVQNDFCSEKGVFKKVGFNVLKYQRIVPRIIKLVQRARELKIPIIFIKAIYDKKYLTPSIHERYKKGGLEKICQLNKWGSDFYKIKPKKEDKIFIKHRYDAFTNPRLKRYLKQKKINTLILTGLTSDVCVDSTARSGFMKGFYIVAIKDCLASTESKEKDLEFYKKYYNAIIINSDLFPS